MWLKIHNSWYWFVHGILEAGPFATKAEGQAWLKEQEQVKA